MKGVEVVAVFDPDDAACSRVVNEYRLPIASSLEEAIHYADAVLVASPTTSHFDIGMKVVAAGRPLFIEKPICATTEEGERLVTAALKAGVPIQVGQIERFNRAVRSLGGRALRPRFIEAHRLAEWNPRGVDVAVVHDLMIHDLDLILYFAGERPSRIEASGVGVITSTIDIANARLTFPSGLVANVTASRISLKRMRKMRLFGASEYISLDLGKGACEVIGVDDGTQGIPEGAIPLGEMELRGLRRRVWRQIPDAPEDDAMRLELTAFQRTVEEGLSPVVSGAEGLAALQLAEAVVAEIEAAVPSLASTSVSG